MLKPFQRYRTPNMVKYNLHTNHPFEHTSLLTHFYNINVVIFYKELTSYEKIYLENEI